MNRRFFRRYTPNQAALRSNRHLKLFGERLYDPNLWHLNRRSVSGAFFVGLFWAFMPFPLQMVSASATAVLARVNLPIAFALVWVTNPLTIPPIFYLNYRVGAWLLGRERFTGDFEPTLQWLMQQIHIIWQPLLLGSVLCGALAGLMGYAAIRLLWRLHIGNYIKTRRARRRARKNNRPPTPSAPRD